MNVKITTKTITIERELLRYSVNESNIVVSISGGILETVPKNGDIATVLIEDATNGNIEKTAQFVSYNFVVYDNAQTGEVEVIGDNTLLLKILDI